jgi:hypothetical protein
MEIFAANVEKNFRMGGIYRIIGWFGMLVILLKIVYYSQQIADVAYDPAYKLTLLFCLVINLTFLFRVIVCSDD